MLIEYKCLRVTFEEGKVETNRGTKLFFRSGGGGHFDILFSIFYKRVNERNGFFFF
jgi:hypothetical protein